MNPLSIVSISAKGDPCLAPSSVPMETPRSGPSRRCQRGKALTLGGAKETLRLERTVLEGVSVNAKPGDRFASWAVHPAVCISEPL
jgi:hypothetical protein